MSQKKRIDNYVIHLSEMIGKGTFGQVYVAYHIQTQQKVAVKILQKKLIQKDSYIKNALDSEVEILKTLKSVNIVGFLDVMASDNNYYIVQEYCDGGDLRKYIQKKSPVPQQEAIQIISQICNGFLQLLKEGVIHRDLKPQNILFNKGIVKICDFGFSKRYNNKRLKYNTIVGTPLYMSIQILKGLPYSSKCDIWALAFIFYQLLHGVTPWNADSQYQLIQRIQSQPLKFPKELHPLTKDFIIRCLKIQEQDRMSWDQLLRHEMFKGCFTHYVKKEHQFQNKLKSLMSTIRYQINSQNIQLDKLLEANGISPNKQMSFDEFKRFLKNIDPHLSNQQIRFAFQKLDRDNSDTISLAEVQTAMIQNNIPFKARNSLVRKQSKTEQMVYFDPRLSEKKIREAFIRLASKMKSRNLLLEEVFRAYDVNKSGDIDYTEFKRIMNRLDNSLKQEEVIYAFNKIDMDSSKTITFDEFQNYFHKCVYQKTYYQ